MTTDEQPAQDGGLTAAITRFICASSGLPLDDDVVRVVSAGFTDTVATMMAGRNQPVVQVVRRFVQGARGAAPDGRARILFAADYAAARDAALVNATAGHALDYDDVALQGHPSTVLAPALLAEGERLRASGAALMRAYVAGYEVWAELIGREPGLHHLKGWHPTGVFGVVAAAAAVLALRGTPAPHCRHAIGLAASHACGLVANFGTMAKPFHAGLAAAHAIDAVNLAEAGMTAAPDVLEHRAGLLAALSPSGQADTASPAASLGRKLRIRELGLSIKKYPMCFATHRIIDAALDLSAAHDLQPAQVRAVRATIGPAQASMLRNHRPQSGLEAKFSLQFAVAAAIVARRIGLAELDNEVVRQPAIQALMEKLSIEVAHTSHPAEPSLAASDRLVIDTTDGRRLDSGEVSDARGTPRLPLAAGELRAKFMDCARGVTHIDADALFDALQNLHEVADVSTLGKR